MSPRIKFLAATLLRVGEGDLRREGLRHRPFLTEQSSPRGPRGCTSSGLRRSTATSGFGDAGSASSFAAHDGTRGSLSRERCSGDGCKCS